MMHPRLLLVLAVLLAICAQECDARKFLDRWREGKKTLRGQQQAAETADEDASPAEATPAEEDAKPVEATPVLSAAGAPDVTIEKQPETPLKTQIGETTPKSGQKVLEPSVPGANGNMGMYHAMGPPGMGPPPGMGMTGSDGNGPPLSVVGASAYNGFWCGPKSTPTVDGLEFVQDQCTKHPICKFKRVKDGAVGMKPISELEPGQDPNCMRRCDPKDDLNESFCAEDEECYEFVMGCPCANLNSKGCEAWAT